MNKRFIILDRDGTVIADKHYLDSPDGVELLPGAAEGMRKMITAGFNLIIVSNQSGINRGLFNAETLDSIHKRMIEILENENISIKGIYYCPHTPDENCACRKPGTGLVLEAADELGFNPEKSWVIGDKAADVQLGKAIGGRAILVLTGEGSQTAKDTVISPDHIAENLSEAADLII